MLSLIVACVVAQMPAASTPDPAWHWTRIHGQDVQVWGSADANGVVNWARHGDWRGDERVAPIELDRRKKAAAVIDQPPLSPRPSPQTPPPNVVPPSLNYGIKIQQLSDDKRTIRASDPETLRKVTAEAAERRQPRQPEYCEVHGTDKCPNGGGCKPDPAPAKKPNFVDRAIDYEIEKVMAYAFGALVVFAAVFVVLRSIPPQE